MIIKYSVVKNWWNLCELSQINPGLSAFLMQIQIFSNYASKKYVNWVNIVWSIRIIIINQSQDNMLSIKVVI